jgi:WD40 repeat protein
MDQRRDATGSPQVAQDKGAPGRPGEVLPSVFIPDHQLLRRVGRGSYGEVWLARDTAGRYRAVKIVHRHTFKHRRPFERELTGIRKFEPISRSHEGLVHVLHIGIHPRQRYFYYVMELGDDRAKGQNIDPRSYSPRTLAKDISFHRRLNGQRCLELGLSLSLALAALHKCGLVHRDIKPSNIIFVNGVPKLADIGLVASADAAQSYVGTSGFIPPEGPGSAQGDVYSLGKVLYEACTGRDRHDFPELPTCLGSLADGDLFLELNEVIMRACRTDLQGRYHSAWSMYEDLLLLANGESIRRINYRNRRLAGLKKVGAVCGALFLALAVVWGQVRREHSNAAQSRQHRIAGQVACARSALDSGDVLAALPHFTEALRLDRGDPERELPHRIRVASTLAQFAKLEQVWFCSGEGGTACFSRTGRRVLVAERGGGVCVLDADGGSVLARWNTRRHRLFDADISPDEQWVVTGAADGSATVWNLHDGSRKRTLEHPGAVYAARCSPDGSKLVTACEDGKARVWDTRTWQLLFVLALHTDAVLFAGFAHNGRLIVTTSRDTTARLWNAANGEPAGPPLSHPNPVSGAAFSPDDRKIVTTCFDYKARVWEIPGGVRIHPDLDHRDGIVSAEFSPDGRWILTDSSAGTARLWSADQLRPLARNAVFGPNVARARFDRDGRRILTACSDGTAKIWNLAGGSLLPEPRTGLRLKATNSVGGGLATATAAPFTAPLRDFRAASKSAPVLSPDRARILTVIGSRVFVKDAQSGTLLFPALEHPSTVTSAEFSRNGARLVTCCANEDRARSFAQTWNACNGQRLGAPLSHNGRVLFASFSPDGRKVVTASQDFTARVWDAATGRPLTPPLKHEHPVNTARFSPDGKWVVTASKDQTARVWNAATGYALTPPLRHVRNLRGASFVEDGRRVITSDVGGRSWIWRLPVDRRPVEDLLSLSELLSGRTVARPGQLMPVEPELLPGLWKGLRRKYPASFMVSPAEVEAWHEFQAEQAQEEHQWFATAFHLKQLAMLRPDDQEIRKRLGAAEENLRKQEALGADDME